MGYPYSPPHYPLHNTGIKNNTRKKEDKIGGGIDGIVPTTVTTAPTARVLKIIPAHTKG